VLEIELRLALDGKFGAGCRKDGMYIINAFIDGLTDLMHSHVVMRENTG